MKADGWKYKLITLDHICQPSPGKQSKSRFASVETKTSHGLFLFRNFTLSQFIVRVVLLLLLLDGWMLYESHISVSEFHWNTVLRDWHHLHLFQVQYCILLPISPPWSLNTSLNNNHWCFTHSPLSERWTRQYVCIMWPPAPCVRMCHVCGSEDNWGGIHSTPVTRPAVRQRHDADCGCTTLHWHRIYFTLISWLILGFAPSFLVHLDVNLDLDGWILRIISWILGKND